MEANPILAPVQNLERSIRKILSLLSTFPRPSKKAILILLLIAAVMIVVSVLILSWPAVITNLKVPSLGKLTTIGVEAYWDKKLENKTEEVYWGTVYQGSSQNVTLYIRSTSNVKTTLSLETTNWTFNNSDGNIASEPTDSTPFMNLTWNYNGTSIDLNETIQVTLTLSTSSSPEFTQYLITNDIKTFSFDILIQASEPPLQQ